MAKKKPTPIAERILRERQLQVGTLAFYCPYCRKHWSRGGHKEGFVKSGANNHVALCYEIVLFGLGFILGPYVQPFGRSVIPVSEASEPWMKRNIRAIRAGLRSRAKVGLVPRRPLIDTPARLRGVIG